MEEWPDSVRRLVSQLEDHGFDRVSDETNSNVFGNRLVIFRRSPLEIRVTKDRSQWSLDVTADGWPEADRIYFPLFHGSG
jgi:hypothetical protein